MGIEVRAADWGSLYRIGGSAACIFLVYSLIAMILLVTIGGPPKNAQDCFAMLRESRMVGLLRLDLLTLFVLPFYYVVVLSLFVALRKTHGACSLIATVLVLTGVSLVLATPSAFSWLALSDKFAGAVSDAERSRLLAAGEAILASDMWHGSGAIVGGILAQTGLLIISLVMLWSNSFGKATAWVGVATHALDLAHIVFGIVMSAAGVFLMATAGPLYLVWFPLLARDLFRLGRRRYLGTPDSAER